MFLVEAENAVEYLRGLGRLTLEQRPTVRELSGGVSNRVLLCEFAAGEAPLVLKQARAQLRTADPWFCGVERIWREVDVLRCCQRLVAADRTPGLIFVDWGNYLFGMTAADPDARPWKDDLLAGIVDPAVAADCGQLLGQLHAGSWHDPQIARAFHDREFFRVLRLDPYYRTVARAHHTWAERFARLSNSVWQNSWCLVHADFTPKNLLVSRGGLLLLDFETGHYGDPAFDLGLFLAHLLLKATAAAPDHARYLQLTSTFWQHYTPAVLERAGGAVFADLVARAAQNTAGCAWARLDGKSKIEYLPSEPARAVVRDLCRWMLATQPRDWAEVYQAWNRALEELSRAEPG